jgi:uncharacterized protein YbaP (TraB family)
MRRLFGCLAITGALVVAPIGAQAPAKHFLWSVNAPGAPPTYLMGSIHVLTADYYP